MIERLQGLAVGPSDEEAARLLRNISQGSLERKWGAIPIALWLAAATHGESGRLSAWVEAKPQGILALAAQYGDPQYRAFSRALARAERPDRSLISICALPPSSMDTLHAQAKDRSRKCVSADAGLNPAEGLEPTLLP
jgi:hypothetical protein